jgi:hypothetical protein
MADDTHHPVLGQAELLAEIAAAAAPNLVLAASGGEGRDEGGAWIRVRPAARNFRS